MDTYRIVGTFVVGALLLCLQGCLAAVWVAAVGVGTSVTGSVEFEPFENTWVAPRPAGGTMTAQAIAVTPFSGDPAMGRHFSTVFQKESALEVVTPKQFSTTHQTPNSVTAQQIAQDFQVDCILFGTVVDQDRPPDQWNGKVVKTKRLYLEMWNAEGSKVWIDELPFTMVEGAQPFPDEWLEDALSRHLTAHAKHFSLYELGFQNPPPRA